ncbi:cupin domain-containing protein [Pseudohaliea sp.]|uniref:cupin domain-containing protein n=1 Tax=Pseudohaliea sp. TaxID=2740289 RepID=UPI0032EFB392
MGYRCIITGEDASGASRCDRDSEVEESAGWMYHFWRASSNPSLTAPLAYPGELPESLEPSPGGSVFRFFHILPDDTLQREELEALVLQTRDRIGAVDMAPSEDGRLWHRTATLDYVVILQGTPELLLEQETISLKPFDVVIQRGTYHAWSNPGPEMAIAACVLLSAEQTEPAESA